MRHLVALSLAALLTPGLARSASFTGLGELPGGEVYSAAIGIAPDGTAVVGWSGAEGGRQGFVWAHGSMTPLARPGTNLDAAGVATTSGGALIVGLNGPLWRDGVLTPLTDAASGQTLDYASAVTPDGAVIAGRVYQNGLEPAIWRAGAITSLGYLPGRPLASPPGEGLAADLSDDGATVVGYASGPTNQIQPFRWTEVTGMTALGDLPGGSVQGMAVATSSDGETATGWSTTETGVQAVRWRGSETLGLGFTSGRSFSEAAAISSDGSIIVGENWAYGFEDREAFIWIEGRGIQSLGEYLVSTFGLDLEGWVLSSASAISADGRVIAGWGVNPEGNIEGWVAVPEPRSLALVALIPALVSACCSLALGRPRRDRSRRR